MSFQSIDQIIKFLEAQPNWEMVRQYRQIQQCWPKVVSSQVLSHTRPLFVNRQVLWVATSSSAWAQNLALQRYSLLKKLNLLLSESLTDVRFSAACWYNLPKIDDTPSPQQANLQKHPSFVNSDEQFSVVHQPLPSKDDPQTFFQDWVQRRQKALQELPLCPRCHCPTPRGELQRWSVCSCCAAGQWSY